MYDYSEGTKYDSLCAFCDKSVPATLTSVTLSLCKGLAEIENDLVDVCNECGNMCSVPAESLPSIQQTARKLLESKVVTNLNDITIDLKSIVDQELDHEEVSRPEYQEKYSLEAAE